LFPNIKTAVSHEIRMALLSVTMDTSSPSRRKTD
jgi:hypothetical protein